MKKIFKTKFKKIISIFTAIVVLTLVLIIPVSAAGQNYVNYTELDIDQFNFTIPSISNSYGSVEPTQHESGFNLWYTSLYDINPISFSDIGSFNWYVSLSANSQLQEGYYTFSLSPVFLFDSNISSNVGSAKVTLTLGSDEKVVVSQTVSGSKVSSFGNSNSVKYDLQFSIYYDPKIHQQLFNDFTLNFNFLNSSVSGNLYYIGFNTSPKLLAPDSISSGASAALDNNSKIEEEITKQPFHNSISNLGMLFHFLSTDLVTYRESFLAIRQVFDEFFGNFYNLTVAYLCLAMSIIVVVSRYMRNRRD